MTTQGTRQAWLDAAKQVRVDSHAGVVCPSCLVGTLLADFVPWGEGNIDLHMSCPLCGARETMTFKEPKRGG